MSSQPYHKSPGSRLRALALPVLNPLAAAVVIGAGLLLGRVLLSPNWSQAVTVVGLTAVVAVLFTRPTAGLLLWIALSPFAGHIYLKLEMGSGIPDLDITRISAAVLMLQAVTQTITRQTKRPGLARVTSVEIAMLGFLAAISLSLGNSSLGLIGGIQTIFDFTFVPMLVYYLARSWLWDAPAQRGTIAVVALVGGLLGAITAREQLTGLTLFSPYPYSGEYEPNIRRVMSLFASPATMSTALAVTAPFLVYGLQRIRGASGRLLLGLALLATLAGAFFVYVRAGWLGAVLGIVMLVLMSPSIRRFVRFLGPLLVILAVLVSVAVIAPGVVQQRLSSDQPISYRLYAWQIAWDFFRGSPLLGIGYDNFGQAAVSQLGWDPHQTSRIDVLPAVHNTYLYVLVSGGLLAILPYLAIFVALAWQGLAYWRAARPGSETRTLVATLWATQLDYMVMIAAFDAINAQVASLLFFLIIGALLGRMAHLKSEDRP